MAGLTDEPIMPTPKNVWLTTEQVIKQFNINPEDRKYEGQIKNMLYPTVWNGTSIQIRCWLKDSIEAVLS